LKVLRLTPWWQPRSQLFRITEDQMGDRRKSSPRWDRLAPRPADADSRDRQRRIAAPASVTTTAPGSTAASTKPHSDLAERSGTTSIRIRPAYRPLRRGTPLTFSGLRWRTSTAAITSFDHGRRGLRRASCRRPMLVDLDMIPRLATDASRPGRNHAGAEFVEIWNAVS